MSMLRGSEAPSGSMIPVNAPCNLQHSCVAVWLWLPLGSLQEVCGKVHAFLRTLSYFSSSESPLSSNTTYSRRWRRNVGGKQSLPCSADLR